MSTWQWHRIHKVELGHFAECFARLQFAMRGWRTYTPFADNHGIDFLAKHPDGRELYVQVKAVRKRTYAFVSKDRIADEERTVVALVLCDEGEAPRLLIVPMSAWKSPNAFLADRNYEGLKSKPEYGLQPSRSNESLMDLYAPDAILL